MTKIPNIRTNIPFDLPARGSWPASRHVFDEESADAIRMALAAERPLLVRGEPGTGKSQLARAAAEELKRLFVRKSSIHAQNHRICNGGLMPLPAWARRRHGA
jgi:DNA polymerase III delta prime subunit